MAALLPSSLGTLRYFGARLRRPVGLRDFHFGNHLRSVFSANYLRSPLHNIFGRFLSAGSSYPPSLDRFRGWGGSGTSLSKRLDAFWRELHELRPGGDLVLGLLSMPKSCDLGPEIFFFRVASGAKYFSLAGRAEFGFSLVGAHISLSGDPHLFAARFIRVPESFTPIRAVGERAFRVAPHKTDKVSLDLRRLVSRYVFNKFCLRNLSDSRCEDTIYDAVLVGFGAVSTALMVQPSVSASHSDIEWSDAVLPKEGIDVKTVMGYGFGSHEQGPILRVVRGSGAGANGSGLRHYDRIAAFAQRAA